MRLQEWVKSMLGALLGGTSSCMQTWQLSVAPVNERVACVTERYVTGAITTSSAKEIGSFNGTSDGMK
jgi:hypothetical protein